MLCCFGIGLVVDRVVLSVSATPIAKEFDISPVQLGYLFSSFLWLYVICLVPMGMIVDKFGTRAVNAATVLSSCPGDDERSRSRARS